MNSGHGPITGRRGRRERVPSASSQRAKRGFRYWNDWKPTIPGEWASSLHVCMSYTLKVCIGGNDLYRLWMEIKKSAENDAAGM